MSNDFGMNARYCDDIEITATQQQQQKSAREAQWRGGDRDGVKDYENVVSIIHFDSVD